MGMRLSILLPSSYFSSLPPLALGTERHLIDELQRCVERIEMCQRFKRAMLNRYPCNLNRLDRPRQS